jgi:hypothetical protein
MNHNRPSTSINACNFIENAKSTMFIPHMIESYKIPKPPNREPAPESHLSNDNRLSAQIRFFISKIIFHYFLIVLLVMKCGQIRGSSYHHSPRSIFTTTISHDIDLVCPFLKTIHTNAPFLLIIYSLSVVLKR